MKTKILKHTIEWILRCPLEETGVVPFAVFFIVLVLIAIAMRLML